ncbi:hypothetical protein A0J61_03685 [Choanephora cucurbitarum]|uniref:Uncharacterized protein n=1 Tax=Choanephora cucurbitarum TaxID=101091 RepID=A0A1C7NGK4_9FUNG|nr:hypothetical protein A0J61_03685 [Choanephora cucurbitarum]
MEEKSSATSSVDNSNKDVKDEDNDKKTDLLETSRSYLQALQSVCKNLLLTSNGAISKEEIRSEVRDCTEQEILAMKFIMGKLQPYLPSKTASKPFISYLFAC